MGIVYLPISVEVRYRYAKRRQQEGAKTHPLLVQSMGKPKFRGGGKGSRFPPPRNSHFLGFQTVVMLLSTRRLITQLWILSSAKSSYKIVIAGGGVTVDNLN
jgi:hypothetical protein